MQKLKIHISIYFLVFALYMIFSHNLSLYIIYFLFLILHEITHAIVAYNYGYKLNKIVLMPYGVVLNGQFEGIKSKDEIIIALAGPMFNIIVSILLVAIWWIIPSLYHITKDVLNANLIIALINFLPIYPLDGGRILLGYISQKMDRNLAYKRIKVVGYILSFLLIGLFVLTIFYKPNLSIGMFGIFILSSTILEDKSIKYENIYRIASRYKKTKKGLVVLEKMISYNTDIIKLYSLLKPDYYTIFIIVDENLREIGRIDELELEKISTLDIKKTLKTYFLVKK